MSEPIHDRVVIVTGAGSGFGRLISQKCGALGARVVCADVDEAQAAATAETIRAAGHQAMFQRADVTRLDDMRALAAGAVDRFGAIDVMVNNAGTMPLAFIADHAQAAPAWDRCIDINVKGVLHGMIAVHDQMIAQGRGHVVNLSSIYGNHAVVGAAVYGATKAAVNMLSDAFRVESQGRIKVTVVRPTGVPGTGLSGGVVNPGAVVGILGQNAEEYFPVMLGQASDEQLDREQPANAILSPSDLVDQILHAVDQPWGVTISDITVRATGDRYVI